jgi:hypothetical protein
MTIRDPFSYSDRWGSVGLDCSYCVHFAGPVTWPDTQRISHCTLHKVSLLIELIDNGYKDGEWFCKDFKDDGGLRTHNGGGRINPLAQKEFDNIKDQLDPQKLYGAYGKNGNLKEYDFNDLKSTT